MKYHLVRLESAIYLDDYEEGQGDYTGCGYQGECIGKTFLTLADATEFLASTYGLPADVNAYDLDDATNTLASGRMVADHSNAQNGGWFEPTQAESDAWRLGTFPLYVEDFYIHFVRCF